MRTYSGRLSFLRIPDEKVKEALSSGRDVEIQIQDVAPYGNEENNETKSVCNFDCNSNFSFDMDSISLDTGCNQVKYMYKYLIWIGITIVVNNHDVWVLGRV